MNSQGTMTEKFLTLSEEEFSCLLRKNTSAEKIPEEKKEAYRYSKVRLSFCTIVLFAYMLVVVEFCYEITAGLSGFQASRYRHI